MQQFIAETQQFIGKIQYFIAKIQQFINISKYIANKCRCPCIEVTKCQGNIH